MIMSSEKMCCVPECSGNSDSQTVLHLFPNPAKDMKRFMTWVFNIGGGILALSNEYIYKNRRVCHAHFETKYCCRYNRISNIAVPTLNMSGLSILKFATSPKERKPLRSIENENILPSTSACQLLVPEQNMSGSLTAKRGKMTVVPENKRSSEVCYNDAIQISQQTFRSKYLKSKMSKTEHELYKKLHQLKVKHSKLRSKSKKQAAELKSAQKLFTNVKFIEALENMPSTGRLITLMQFREIKKKKKDGDFQSKKNLYHCL